MATKSLDNEIFHYLPLLGSDEKQTILSVIKSFLKLHKPVNSISIEEYNKEIDDAVARVESGEYYTHEEVEKMAKEW